MEVSPTRSGSRRTSVDSENNDLSPRAPAQKRAKESSANAPQVPIAARARNDLGWINQCIGNCVLSKAMKADTSRSLLERVASLTDVVNKLVTENAVLLGRIEEARLRSSLRFSRIRMRP